MRKPTCLLSLALLSVAVSGCASLSGKLVSTAPNRIGLSQPTVRGKPVVYDHEFFVPVGPPHAQLKVSTLEPRIEGPTGTVVVLHGIYSQSDSMVPFAQTFSNCGFRTVFVDLRGHGRSTGEHTTFGVHESSDISQVLDALEQRGLLVGNVGICGHSLGASTAIQSAARDPRIKAVVAISPHNSFRDAVQQIIRTRVPVLRFVASDQWIQQLVNEAGRAGHFDPNHANSLAAIQAGDVPVLLMHGTKDRVILPYHSVSLHDAAPENSELVLLHGAGHAGLINEHRVHASQLATQWFRRWLVSPIASRN